MRFTLIILMSFIVTFSTSFADDISFGDDSSPSALDGICDDVRFLGEGMSDALHFDSIGHDATDCQNEFDAGRITWTEESAREAKGTAEALRSCYQRPNCDFW